MNRRQLLAFTGGALVLARSGPALADTRTVVPRRLLDGARAKLEQHGDRIAFRDRISIVDFSQPSRAARFSIIDLASGAETVHLVAHGRGSDPRHSGWVERFSNDPGSYASSDGAYATGAVYEGKHGRSMHLVGLEHGNSNAEARAIVIHAASYVSAEMARHDGKLGRSLGCFALAPTDLASVVERLGPGRLLFAAKL